MGRAELLERFSIFCGNGGGIEQWFSPQSMPESVSDVLLACAEQPVNPERFNQLLIISHEAGVSRGFFRFYFCHDPSTDDSYPYDPKLLASFSKAYIGSSSISSIDQLYWGFERLYIDGLLHFGNIRQGFRSLRSRTFEDIASFIKSKTYSASDLSARGAPLPLSMIAKDDRYLIAEMACKTFEPSEERKGDLLQFLKARRAAMSPGNRPITIRDIISSQKDNPYSEEQLNLSLDEILDQRVEDDGRLESVVAAITAKFTTARDKALVNTRLYLSGISDLDIYVATSMRNRNDFRAMATFCEAVFSDPRVADLNLRYFDPTMSAAVGHEDKGLIECLMVKSAKALVYNAGTKDSFGKDVEAAMAMSLGKPVIFFCDQSTRAKFYREVHPLARLIHFETGVAAGAIVTDQREQVAELLSRIFRNRMEYVLDKKASGYFLLKEKLTGSTVRLQTNDSLLRETFWNYYNREAGMND